MAIIRRLFCFDKYLINEKTHERKLSGILMWITLSFFSYPLLVLCNTLKEKDTKELESTELDLPSPSEDLESLETETEELEV